MTPGPGDPPRRALARHPDEETRYRATSLLDPADAGDRELLLERLGDPSWRVRAAAVERIAAPGGAAALPRLVEALSGGASAGAREAAAVALARLGVQAVPPLLERLGAPGADLRQAAAAVLGVIADRRAAAPLAALLADPDPNVRAAAAEALGRVGGGEAIDALRAAVGSEDATLELTALEALVRLGAGLPAARVEGLLGDRALRLPAYRLIGASDDPEVLALLPRGLAEPSRSAREAALAALGQQRSRRTPGALAPLLEAVRAAAARDPGLADAWAGSLASGERHVAAGALAALGVAGAARHAAGMLRLAEDHGLRPLVEEAVEALPPGPELRAALAEGLPSLGPMGRLVALTALARLGSPTALESLVREASDPGSRVRAEAVAAPMSEEEFRLLRDLVHEHCGLAFGDEMSPLLERRLAPRLEALGMGTYAEYHRFLRVDPGRQAELEEAVDLLTTNETYFYREPLQLDAFAREILPACARSLAAERRLRILSAGCSTGEEAYTLAVMVRDSRLFEGWDVEVVGADISRRCLAAARAGAYGEHAFRNPEAAPMRRWFSRRGGKWVIDDDIKKWVRFTRENLLDAGSLASVSEVDVLFCRNVMIYFDLPARRQVLRRLHRALRQGGWLLLGHSESLLNVTADFELVHLKSDLVYRKPFGPAAGVDR